METLSNKNKNKASPPPRPTREYVTWRHVRSPRAGVPLLYPTLQQYVKLNLPPGTHVEQLSLRPFSDSVRSGTEPRPPKIFFLKKKKEKAFFFYPYYFLIVIIIIEFNSVAIRDEFGDVDRCGCGSRLRSVREQMILDVFWVGNCSWFHDWFRFTFLPPFVY